MEEPVVLLVSILQGLLKVKKSHSGWFQQER